MQPAVLRTSVLHVTMDCGVEYLSCEWNQYCTHTPSPDGDGIGNNEDTDDDNDGVADDEDAFQFDSSESLDTDLDGIGNNADTDDDNDGVDDASDDLPLDASDYIDTDGDGTGNLTDTDDDGDGTADTLDPLPLDNTVTTWGTDPNAITCPTGTTSTGTGYCELPSQISSDLTLTAGNAYLLNGVVTVGNGNQELASTTELASGAALQNVTLTIEAGVNVYGKTNTGAVLIITRGSQINANGTESNPITFSGEDEGFVGTGEFGGLVLQGFSADIEYNYGEGFFGKPDNTLRSDNGSSGVLRYVRVVESGSEVADVSGIEFQGVGSGTVVENIHVHSGRYLGLIAYHGNLNAKHLVISDMTLSSLAPSEGVQGSLQFILIKQSNETSSTHDALLFNSVNGVSNPTLANVTMI